MKTLRMIFQETFGLFVDDGSLAIALLCLLAVILVLARENLVTGGIAAVLLLAGTLIALCENVVRSARRSVRRRDARPD